MMTEDRLADTSVLTSLFRHNTWATLRLLDFCAGSSDDAMRVFAAGSPTNSMWLEVIWRSGRHSRVPDVRANRLYEIDE